MEFVDKYYEMDPETDLYCPTGFLLQRGWVVLIETHERKAHLDEDGPEYWSLPTLEKAKRWNRWARVVDVRFSAENGGTLYLALCYDNVVKQLSCSQNLAWLVKKDSVDFPEVEAKDGIIVNDD